MLAPLLLEFNEPGKIKNTLTKILKYTAKVKLISYLESQTRLHLIHTRLAKSQHRRLTIYL